MGGKSFAAMIAVVLLGGPVPSLWAQETPRDAAPAPIAPDPVSVSISETSAANRDAATSSNQDASSNRDAANPQEAAPTIEPTSAGQSHSDAAAGDVEGIRQASRSYVEAYNQRDASRLAGLWSETAVYVMPDTGEQLQGREAIRQMFEGLFAQTQRVELHVEIESIRMIAHDVASERGLAFTSDGQSISASRYTAIYVRSGDHWLLDSIHDTELAQEGGQVTPLSQLEWMIGEWVDQSEESTVETKVQWTSNRKFLTRHFSVTAAGREELSGTQVIGFDPIRQQIRSWVFDSDGGFSNGAWTRKGDNWVVESTGYLGDGGAVSSIQVYERIDQNTFIWQSFGREVDGQRIPDIAPVRVIRK